MPVARQPAAKRTRWLIIAPFSRPVVPLVYPTMTRSPATREDILSAERVSVISSSYPVAPGAQVLPSPVRRPRPYRDDVDYFGVCCPDTDAVYLVPITDVPDRGACLRVKPTKNNQAKGVRWAKDYVLGDKVKVADAAG